MKPLVILPLLVGIQGVLLIKGTFVRVLVSKLKLKETVLHVVSKLKLPWVWEFPVLTVHLKNCPR